MRSRIEWAAPVDTVILSAPRASRSLTTKKRRKTMGEQLWICSDKECQFFQECSQAKPHKKSSLCSGKSVWSCPMGCVPVTEEEERDDE